MPSTLNVFQLRQPLHDVQCFPSDRRAAEVQFLQSAEDAELPHRRVGNRAAGQIEPAKLQQFVALADEIFDELFAVARVVAAGCRGSFR